MKKLLLLFSLILLSACQPVGLPAVNTFTFQPQYLTTHVATINKVLFVATPTAAPGFKTNKIAYSERAFQIKYFTRNEWIDPPAQMLLPVLAEALQRSHRFKSVVIEPFTGNADLRLDTQILQLIQQFNGPHSSNFLVVIRGQLLDLHSGRVLASRIFSYSQPVGHKIYDAIIAANLALSKILDSMTHFAG